MLQLFLAEGPAFTGLLITGLISAALGAAGAVAFLVLREKTVLATQRARVHEEVAEAQKKREAILSGAEIEAQKKLLETMNRFEQETAETRRELKELDRKLAKREDNVDRKMDVLNTKEKKIEDQDREIVKRREEADADRAHASGLLTKQKEELLRITKLSADEARALCLRRIEEDVEREAGQKVEAILTHAQENARGRARQIIIEAIQRYAAEHTSEATVGTVDVPSDDMKGRVIGREGRNIRAFEKVTGVTLIVDDTPGIVAISCFDPVRKEIARLSLERLIKDGRIHPTRIEEIVEETSKEIDERIMEAGKAATLEANVNGLHKKVVETLGRLQYRTSYGQNVLRHSIEVAALCGIMSEELGLDAALGRRAGLLHDIGKALPHDLGGSHTKIGAEFCKRHQEPLAVVNAAEGHHGDVAAATPYTPLVTAADAISASRPGSRRESLERYIRRLQELEEIATGFEGVRQAYAVEAGREVRVIVDAVHVDDRSTLKLARDIAKRIEETAESYPGEIKVTVLREIRAVEYAR